MKKDDEQNDRFLPYYERLPASIVLPPKRMFVLGLLQVLGTCQTQFFGLLGSALGRWRRCSGSRRRGGVTARENVGFQGKSQGAGYLKRFVFFFGEQ